MGAVLPALSLLKKGEIFLAGIKGRSGHSGAIGLDCQSSMFQFKGLYRAECVLTRKDLFFETKRKMLDTIQNKIEFYTPMIWDSVAEQYIIDWDSADLLGQ